MIRMVYSVLQAGWQPFIGFLAIEKSGLSVSCFSISPSSAVHASYIKIGSYILSEFYFALEQNFILRCYSDSDMFGSCIYTYMTILFRFAGCVSQLNCKRIVSINNSLTFFQKQSGFSLCAWHQWFATHIEYKYSHSFYLWQLLASAAPFLWKFVTLRQCYKCLS